MCLTERAISAAHRVGPRVGGANRPVRPVDQHLLDLPHVLLREAPVVGLEHSQIDDAVGFHASGEVDVSLVVTECQRARRREHRLPAVQSGIARPRHRSPAARRPVDEDHVVQQIDRLEAEDQRRIPMLLEDDRRGECRFQAVRGPGADDAAE